MSFPGLLKQLELSAVEIWTRRDARERTLLSAAAGVVGLGLIYLLLIGPALSGREKMNNELPHLRQQVAQLQALSKQSAALSGKPAAVAAAITRGSIENSLARNGLKPQSLLLTGDYTKVQLAAVSFAGTLAWLDDMQRTALLYVVDADIVALDRADLVDAKLTLRQTRGE